MQTRRILLFSVALIVTLGLRGNAFAEDATLPTRVHKGTVVSISADTLVTQGISGSKKEHTYTVAPTAAVTCETHPCKLTDLKAGEQVTITVENHEDGKALATKVEAP
jgi:hypothetical protein